MLEARLKRVAKNAVNRIAPDILDIRRAYLQRIENKKTYWDRQNLSARNVYGSDQTIILNGPFKGMRYLNETVWGPIEPKWFGTYELEIQNVIGEILKRKYETVIDVGSAEGYYSVGLAWRMPGSKVFSYEIDPWSRKQQTRLAGLNQVSNVHISGRCTHAEIDHRSKGKTLIICDIEGFELELLNPEKAVSLFKADCLVEIHSFHDISMTKMEEKIIERFTVSHAIKRYTMTLRDYAMLPRALNPEINLDVDLLDERRGMKQVWLWMSAN